MCMRLCTLWTCPHCAHVHTIVHGADSADNASTCAHGCTVHHAYRARMCAHGNACGQCWQCIRLFALSALPTVVRNGRRVSGACGGDGVWCTRAARSAWVVFGLVVCACSVVAPLSVASRSCWRVRIRCVVPFGRWFGWCFYVVRVALVARNRSLHDSSGRGSCSHHHSLSCVEASTHCPSLTLQQWNRSMTGAGGSHAIARRVNRSSLVLSHECFQRSCPHHRVASCGYADADDSRHWLPHGTAHR